MRIARALQRACVLASSAILAGAVAPALVEAHRNAPKTHGPDLAPAAGGGFLAKKVPPVSDFAPEAWCGTQRGGDDREHEVANGSHVYHVVYAMASDAPDRFAQEATRIQTKVFQASHLIERLYGRTVRFDIGTDCGPQYVDVSTVRLPQSTAELEQLKRVPNGTLNAVLAGLPERGFPTVGSLDEGFAEPPPSDDPTARVRNFVVFFDGPAPPGACGQATLFDDDVRDSSNINNSGGKVAMIYREDGAFCSSDIVRHEIGHTLGSVTAGAPNNGDGSHCNDAYEDTMCSKGAPKVVGGKFESIYFDYGNDDYWDPPAGPPLPWWTLNLSQYLCEDPVCNYPGVDPSSVPPPQPADVPKHSAPARKKGEVSVDAARAGRYWRVRVRAQGSGRAAITIKCRPSSRVRTRPVYTRIAKLPVVVRARVRCWSPPTASVKRIKRR